MNALGDVDEYLKTTRRKRSEALCGAGAGRHSGVRGGVTSVTSVTSVSRAPGNISRAQRLLQTGMLARQGGPLVPERLELHIPAIRHNTVTTMQQVRGGVTISWEDLLMRCRELRGLKEAK